jgi:hypothetical protein
VVVAACVAGCTQQDENPAWAPESDYPSWAYDAPFYYRPTEDLRVVETVGEGVPVYHTRDELFFVKHPRGYQLTGVPRVSVWASRDAGKHWTRSGYFGIEQSHFLFRAESDGRYWLRFVGPGQGITRVPPGMPHRIYVVDRAAPQIELEIDPPPWTMQDDQKVPYIYKVGEPITLRWVVHDENLDEETVKMGTSFAEFPHNLVWSEWPSALPRAQSMIVEIPPEAVKEGGMRFRMEAADKAGNVGLAMTEPLQITAEGATEAVATVPPIPPEEREREIHGPESSRTGWPTAGSFHRGGSAAVLNWLPDDAATYETVALQFSPTNGQTWRTLATGIKPALPVKWTVPRVTSKACRLRVVGLSQKDNEIVEVTLATSPRFIVDTVTIEMEPPTAGGEGQQ